MFFKAGPLGCWMHRTLVLNTRTLTTGWWSVQDFGYETRLAVAEPPELFQLKCLSHASGAVTHLNRNNPSVPQI
jgi:hypothetical protein